MTFADIRSKYDIQSILNTNKKWMLCPLPGHTHSSNTPSFSIYWRQHGAENRQKFKCHGSCGAFGDVIDLIGYMNIPDYNPLSLPMKKQAASILTGGSFEVSHPLAPPPPPPLSQWLAQEFLPIHPECRKYLIDRGVQDWQIEKYMLGSAQSLNEEGIPTKGRDHLISFPVFHQGKLMGIKLRKTKADKQYRYFCVPGSQPGLYFYDEVFLTSEINFVVKGEIAALVLQAFLKQNNLKAVQSAPTHGEQGFVDNFRSVLSFAKNVIIGDNDPNPKTRLDMQVAAQKRAAVLGGLLRFPDEGYKDIDDQILRDPQRSLSMLQRWITEAEQYA